MVGTPVLERDTEIAALGRLMSRAAAGRGGLVCVEGPAGIGKSWLLGHAREKATGSGWRVLDTRCTPMSATIDFCLLRDWFSTLAHRAGGDGHPFAGPGRVLADLSGGTTRGIGDLVYGVRWVLEDLTQDQPVLLVADDLQWADVGSLETLDLLANALQHLPCLIVYGVRTGEPVSSPETLRRIQQSSRVLAPAPLSRAAVAMLLHEERPETSQDDVQRVLESTGGVPFFVREVVGDPNAMPDTVVGSVAGRLTRLSDTATRTARAVCVLGPAAGVGTAAELSGLRLETVADDISALVAAQLLTLDHGRLAAQHPLIADAVLAGMNSAEAADLHAQAARLLVRRGAARAVVASHLLPTIPTGDEDVRQRLTEQGEAALAGGNHAMAIEYLDRALAEGPVDERHVPLVSALARARAAAGEIDLALAAWELASGLTEDPDLLALLKAEAGDALVMVGRHGDAQQAFGSMGDVGDSGRPAQQQLVARMVLAGMLTGVPAAELRDQVGRVPVPPAGDSYDDRLARAARAVVDTFTGEDADGARALALAAAGDGRLLLDEGAEGAGVFMATQVLTWTSAFEEAEALLTSAIETAHSHASVMGLATAASGRGYARMRMGMVTEAILDFDSALGQRRYGWRAHLGAVLAGLVECRVARGELDLAEGIRRDLEEIAHQPGLNGTFATWALADLAEAGGDHERAASLFAEVGQLVARRMDNPALLPWRSGQALALTRVGRVREAVPLAGENVDRARRFGAPHAVAQGLRTLAAVDPTSDRVRLLREALETLRGTRSLRLEAQIAADLAGMMVLHGSRDTDEVVRLLRLAESHASYQELRPLGDRVQRLLERLGEPVSRGGSESVNTLTVSERRVAELAASGLSNRQIAQQLFVTVKAVEWHLSNVYRKLGIRSRTRLPAVLAVPAPRSEPTMSTSSTVVG